MTNQETICFLVINYLPVKFMFAAVAANSDVADVPLRLLSVRYWPWRMFALPEFSLVVILFKNYVTNFNFLLR